MTADETTAVRRCTRWAGIRHWRRRRNGLRAAYRISPNRLEQRTFSFQPGISKDSDFAWKVNTSLLGDINCQGDGSIEATVSCLEQPVWYLLLHHRHCYIAASMHSSKNMPRELHRGSKNFRKLVDGGCAHIIIGNLFTVIAVYTVPYIKS